MPYRPSRVALHQLHALARTQGGYFTAKQAASLGYDYPHLSYHAKAGNIERVGHGVYRLVTIPVSEHDDLIRLSLWSRNRADEPESVVSHSTALVLHCLTDMLPKTIHLTVPLRFHKKAPPGCRLHKAELEDRDVEEHDGFWVTSALRTLLDAAGSPDVPQDEIESAARAALERGLVRGSELARAVEHSPHRKRLMSAIELPRGRSR
jgi:predicted transcriptional regulator of viral defense system